MRALRISLRAAEPIILPLAYNELVQGLLYSCWVESYPELHDEGMRGVKGFRPFTFGRLHGKANVKRDAKTIRFEETLSLEVRSPVEELVDELARQLAARGKARIGAHELEVVNLECCDRLLFPQRAVISLEGPLVCYQRLEDGHTRYFEPGEEGWLGLVQKNAAWKSEALGLAGNGETQLIPLAETLRKHVTHFKGTYVTGWTGDLILACNPELMAALWCLGLGSKNSQGFGMFRISDRRI